MKVVQAYKKSSTSEWIFITENQELNNPLVMVFGGRKLLENTNIYNEIKAKFPYDNIVFGSTSGEIIEGEVFDDSISVTMIEFEKSNYIINRDNILDYNKDAKALGNALTKTFPKENLKHLIIISEGSFVNGSSLIAGLEDDLHNNTVITGGLCGDGSRFETTLASYNENPKEGEVIAIGFYGDNLEFSFASVGGWSTFGPERIITDSKENILYKIDDTPALDIYSKYLGDKASELPQASLLYPLNIVAQGKSKAVVRTILNIDRENNSMILAGDVPVGSRVQLMMASLNGIESGAYEAAKLAMTDRKKEPEFAFLVSCIGRKIVLDQRVQDEIDEVRDVIGLQVPVAGFYSYGEMAPFQGETSCELHNQTMTLTLISE
ncbi:FIST signal transduction protein [Saccharicrinis aurantiacus]|uniref:FIST signal transduction protein n=1 Tax=Saccharicrinis aurantiacus TaxID=1849719 RepID=UPI00094F7D3D|nr:FIST N-terminal domain-containing protein [Saccharicrinis aurantiacus]